MKHALSVLVLPLVLLSCERDHGGDPLVTPPDAPGDEAPDTSLGPGPGAGNPLEPDQRIECELESGYTEQIQQGQVASKITASVAMAGRTLPQGRPWLCFDTRPAAVDCRVSETCNYVGEVTLARCNEAPWQVSEQGEYYISCGSRTEYDFDRDGVFEQSSEYAGSHVAIIAP